MTVAGRGAMQADVVVIGAGIVGTSCAYYLAREGMMVCLLDRAGIAGGTSGSGEGNILLCDKAPGPELDLAIPGCRLWQELAHDLDVDFEYEEKGGIVVSENERQQRALADLVAAMQGVGVTARLLDEAERRGLEPHLSPEVAGAAYFPHDAQVQPMLACAALARAARLHGAVVMSHTDVTAIERDGHGAVRGVVTTAGRIATARVVNAAGPWSPRIAAMAGVQTPIRPRKGHIVVTEPLPRLVYHKVIEAAYADAVTSDDAALQVAAVVEDTRSGTILLGSSRELVGFEPTVRLEVARAIVRRAVRFFPMLGQARALRAYVGFRAIAPDHLPIIGAEPDVPGLYTNTGHEGAGICLGPISGKLLSQLIFDRPTVVDPAPFRPARFRQPDAALA